MRVAPILAATAIVLASRSAGADGFEIAAMLGYAMPLGSAERGSQISDTTFGQVPFAIEAGYRLTSIVGVVARALVGVGIPTQCVTLAECESSLGSDVSFTLGARFFLPRIGPVEPIADAGLGYEWLTAKLADGDATSTRAYHGPVLLSLELAAPFSLGRRWTLGPMLGVSIGRFTSYALETNALSPSGAVPNGTWHGWLSVGIRAGLSL